MRSFLRLAGFTALFAAGFLALTWPLAAHFTTDYLGGPGSDAHQYVWNAWYFRRAVLAGHNPMYTRELLFPAGVNLWLHTYTPIIGVLHLLVPIGSVAVTNLALTLSFGLSGAGATWLARRWRLGWGAALAVGVWFAFGALKTAHLPEHYHLLLTGAVPFYVGLLPQALRFEVGRWRPAVADGRALAGCVALGLITALSDYYTTFWLLYFSAVLVGWHGARVREWRWRRWQPWAAVGGGVALAHVSVRLLQHARVENRGGLGWSADLGGYLVPPPHLRFLHGPWSEAFYGHVVQLPYSIENIVFLGLLIPGLLLVLTLTRQPTGLAAPTDPAEQYRAQLGPAFAAAAVFFLLVTVPEGRIFGHNSLRPPTALLHFVPFLNNLRCPARAGVMLNLLVPLLTLRALTRRPWGRAAAWQWGLPLVAVLETWPQPIPRTHVPAVAAPYEAVRALAAPGTLVATPLGIRDGMRLAGYVLTDDLLYQTLHEHALVGAYASRLDPARFAEIRADPVLGRFILAQADSALATLPSAAEISAFRARVQPSAYLLRPGYQSAAIRRLVAVLTAGQGFRERQLVGGAVLVYRPAGARPVIGHRASSKN
ncbi:MAG: hypothetical protein H7330_16715 [Hymenobacteraceae bacterium]|nr:hypothetical protein [Hymenobacteraceae bacterium]